MKKARKILSFALAFILLAAELQITGLTVNAQNEYGEIVAETLEEESSVEETVEELPEEEAETETLEKETTVEETETETLVEEIEQIEIVEDGADDSEMTTEAITSITYYMTVSNSGNLTSLPWKATDVNWGTKEQSIAINGDGEYSVTLSFDSVAGMKNLGYIDCYEKDENNNDVLKDEFKDCDIKVTITKITVNNSYDLVYESDPVLDITTNGLANIWNVSVGEKICGTNSAYLALDKTDGAITFYATKEKEEIITESSSLDYVKKMGSGWNLGNTFDGFDVGAEGDLAGGETAWGNPAVTKELIAAVKAKGYKRVFVSRLPFM